MLHVCTCKLARQHVHVHFFLMLSIAEEAVVLGAEKDNMQENSMQFYKTNNLETSFPSAPLTPLGKFKS